MPTPRQYGKASKQREILYDIPPISPDKPFQVGPSDDRGVLTGNNRITNGGPSKNPRRTVMESPLRSPIDGRSSVENGYGVRRPDSRGTLRSPPPLPSRRGSGSPLESAREGSIMSGRSSTYTKRGGDRVTSPNPAVSKLDYLHRFRIDVIKSGFGPIQSSLPDHLLYNKPARRIIGIHLVDTRVPASIPSCNIHAHSSISPCPSSRPRYTSPPDRVPRLDLINVRQCES